MVNKYGLWLFTNSSGIQVCQKSRCKLPVKIVHLPSSELSSLHSEVHPSLLPTSLGGSQEDKVDYTSPLSWVWTDLKMIKWETGRGEPLLGWWRLGRETPITAKRFVRCLQAETLNQQQPSSFLFWVISSFYWKKISNFAHTQMFCKWTQMQSCRVSGI